MLLDRRRFIQSMTAAGVVLPLVSSRAFGQSSNAPIRVGVSTYPTPFIPGKRGTTGTATFFSWALQHIRMLQYDQQGVLEGVLAESWELESDNVWVFKLREVKFSDGSPLTSDDVRWTIEFYTDPETGFGDRGQFAEFTIETPDDRTVRIITASPNPSVPDLMAHYQFFVFSRNFDPASDRGIGAGPFVLESYERGVYANFVRNPHYYKPGQPYADGVEMITYSDENLRVAALLAGDVDVIELVPWGSVSTVSDTPGFVVPLEKEGGLLLAAINGGGVLGNPKLRLAVCHAIRRQEIVDTVFFGHGSPMNGTLRMPGSPFYTDATYNYYHNDPELIRSLLQEGGAPDGFDMTLFAPGDFHFYRESGVLIQSHLADYGIRVNLQMPDLATSQQAQQRGEGDMFLGGGGLSSLDPVAITRQRMDPSGPTISGRGFNYSIDGLSDLMNRAARELDDNARATLIHEMDHLILDNAGFCGLVYRATVYGHRAELEGFRLQPWLISTQSLNFCDEWRLNA